MLGGLHVLLCASALFGLLLTACFGAPAFGLSRICLGACELGPLALTLLRLRNRFLLAPAQRDHARIFGALSGVTGSGLNRLPLFAAIVILGAIK